MEQKRNPEWGGARPNAGRKKGGEQKKQYGIRLTLEEYHLVCAALYGLRWKESEAHRPAVELLEFARTEARHECGQVYSDMMARKSPSIEHQIQNSGAYVVGESYKKRLEKLK